MLACGLITLGAVAVANLDDGDTARTSRTEIFVGCLNDIECSGESSQLPLGYWERPSAAPTD